MKKIKFLLILGIIFTLTGCFKNDNMEDIKIVTSIYPVQYVVNTLYGEHSEINSIYPNDSNINDFKVTKVLLKQYSDSELFIFNGLTDEKKHVESMIKNNKDLKIIDITSNMNFEYSIEELWLDPNNLLTIANNIKMGFEEYIKSTYLLNEINENYEQLKIELTNLDGSYYSTIKNSNYQSIIVSDDSFKFLEKYGLKVISLDPDTTNQKEIASAKDLIDTNNCDYIFINYKENLNDTLKEVINKTNAKTLELYTMTDLSDINVDKSNYVTLMNENLENIKMELYK